MSIVEIIKIDMHNVSSADDKTQLYYLRKIYVPIIYLTTIFGTAPVTHDLTDKYLIVVEVNGQFYGLLCDEVLSQQQIVIKSLQDNFEKVPGIAGATILGDGSVTLILDVNTIVDIFRNAGKEDILADHAELAIHEKRQLETDPTKKMLFLGFHLDGKEYAVNILDVLEIRNNQQPLTPLPNVPPYIKGVMNLRGLIVPVADLQDRLALQQVEYNAKDAIIVLDIPRGHLRKVVGILVDSVSDTYNLTSAAIKPLPEGGVTAIADFVMGLAQVNHQTITLLYADSLIGFSGAN